MITLPSLVIFLTGSKKLIKEVLTLISIFNNTLEGIIALLFYTFIIGQKKFIFNNKLKSILYLLTYNVFCFYLDSLISTSGLHTILYIIFYIVFIGNITKTSFGKSFVTVMLVSILFTITELLLILISMLIFRKGYLEIIIIPRFLIFGGLIIRIIQFLLVLLLNKYYMGSFEKILFHNKKNGVPTGLAQIYVFSLFCVVSFWKEGFQYQNSITNQFIAMSLCALTIIFGLVEYKERDKEMKVNYRLKLQEANFQNMEKLIGILRKNQHDIGNHLNTILAITKLRKDDSLDRIEAYISSLTDSIKSSFKSYDTGNSYINSLLAVKDNEATEKGIRLEVDFNAKLDLLQISDQVLISIISNIIDNAFDAMDNITHSNHKFISIFGYIENNMYNLSICNNGPVILKQNLGKIFELGFSTKGTLSGYNGYGLYIVRQFVKEYNGEITVTSDEDETEFLIRFPLI